MPILPDPPRAPASMPVSQQPRVAPQAFAMQPQGPSASERDCVFDVAANDGRNAPWRHAPAQRPAWWQRAVAAPTRRALQKHAQRDSLLRAQWPDRLAAFELHTAALTPRQSAAWLAQQCVDAVHVPRRWLSTKLSPGQMLCPSERIFDERTAQGLRLVPKAAITADHAMLDGLLIRHLGERPERAPILVVPSNTMRWEKSEPWLALLAEETQRNVLMFNYRKMGASVGSVRNTNTAIRDAEAAILCAHAMAPREPLGVVGISLGAACSAAAIAQLKRAGQLSDADVGHWVGLHTFAPFSSLVGLMFGRSFGCAAPACLAILGLDPLDTQKTLNTVPLAHAISIVNAEELALFAPQTQLRIPSPWPEAWSAVVRSADVTVHVGAIQDGVQSAMRVGTWVAQLTDG